MQLALHGLTVTAGGCVFVAGKVLVRGLPIAYVGFLIVVAAGQ